MKLAVVLDEENKLCSLDMGEKIDLIDTDGKKILEYENPGFQRPHGGKEIAMNAILQIKPDALAVKEGFLCPGSYRMSVNRIKYALTNANDLEELLSEINNLNHNLVEDLSIEVFRE